MKRALKILKPNHLTGLSFLFLLLSLPAFGADRPDWINDYNRRIINGDIVHYGIGIGHLPGEAQSKAEEMAIRSMVLECSLAHKNMIISDRFLEQTVEGFKAHVRVSLAFEDCEKAKHASPEARKLMESEILKLSHEKLSNSPAQPIVVQPVVSQSLVTSQPVTTQASVAQSLANREEIDAPYRSYISLFLQLPGVMSSPEKKMEASLTSVGLIFEWRFLPQLAIQGGSYGVTGSSSEPVSGSRFTSESTVTGSQLTLGMPYYFKDPDMNQFTFFAGPEYVHLDLHASSYTTRGYSAVLLKENSSTSAFGSSSSQSSHYKLSGIGAFAGAQIRTSLTSHFIFRALLGAYYFGVSGKSGLAPLSGALSLGYKF